MIEFDLLKVGDGAEIEDRDDLVKDLELGSIIGAIAQKDDLVARELSHVLLLSRADVNSIKYRQETVKDAIQNRNTILDMYKLTNNIIEETKRAVFLVRYDDAESVVYKTASGLRLMIGALKGLRSIIEGSGFSSEAFRGLVGSIDENADDSFILSAGELLNYLNFGNSTEFSVQLGTGNTLRDPVFLAPKRESGIMKRLLGGRSGYVFKVNQNDESGGMILGHINNWVLSSLAPTMLRAYEHLLQFFTTLRAQLAFFVGAINMYDLFERAGLPMAYPNFSRGSISFRDLYPLSLAISAGGKPVPNSLDAHDVNAFVITGLNGGGKTTFLKSIGQAILLARAGLFVPASEFTIPSPGAVFTHFEREEERTMSYGKFEEEIVRLSKIIKLLKPGDYILMNESFSTTNQVEASAVAEQVVSAMMDSGITVFYVTFLQDFIYKFINYNKNRAILLTPERLKDGTRTFRLVESSVQPGYAVEIWNRFFP